MMLPKISVIIPVYKVEKYLEECLDSVLNQSFTNFEVIVIDDGSPDKCPEICDKYEKIDSRIKVIHKKNGGLSSARNIGIDVCQGDYICFIDSDDYIEQNYLEIMLHNMESGDYDFVSCAANFVNEQGKIIHRNAYSVERKEIENNIWDSYFHSNLIEDAVWNKMYNRNIFSDVRFKEGIIYEDSEVIVRILKKCKKILFTNKYLYNYRIRQDSILGYTGNGIQNTEFSMSKMDIFKVYQLCAEELKNTEWENGYYRRIIYTCADYSLKICDIENRNLKKQVFFYFKYASERYSLDHFSVKEQISILMRVYMPKIYKIIKGNEDERKQ